ncbi:MAG: N-acetyltransferase [Bacteroides sp.]|nr:N-acetyltransferase [Bacteroides sp.]
MTEDYKLINNESKSQYEFHVDSYIPKIEYVINKDNDIFLTHTEVHPAISGKGIGTQLVKKTLTDIDNKDMKVVPLCPFVASYIKAHPEWMHLVKEGISIG